MGAGEVSWNNDKDGCDPKRTVERYRERCGHYPESVYADKLYRMRENRERLRQIRTDEGIRNAVEGKFGLAKRRYGLGWVIAGLVGCSMTAVLIIFLAMNLDRLLNQLFCVVSDGATG